MAILETENLRRSFGALVAVDGVSLSVPEGETRGIIGPNGAGKTTFFNCITGFLSPDSGEVRFCGEPITGLPPHEITQRGVARSFQIPQLFENMTVAENVYLARLGRETDQFSFDVFRSADGAEYIEEAGTEILERIGLADRRDEPVSNLSHGDKRRLEIGMTHALESSLLLLDEPAAGLSISALEDMKAFLRSITDGYTSLIIEHNMDVIFGICDRITVLHNGEEYFTGTPEEVRNNDRINEIYFR